MSRTLTLSSLEEMQALAHTVALSIRMSDAILLSGCLGAGKSTFARFFLRHLCQDEDMEVPSPSYTLVQTYEGPGGLVLSHFDLWRLEGEDAMEELGWDDACAGIVLVEWPERLGSLRPADALHIHFEVTGEHSRSATLSGWEGRPVWDALSAWGSGS